MPRRLALALALAAAAWACPAAAAPAKRPVPDYDGRAAAPPSAADYVLFVPRAILFPVRLGVDYLVRRPLGFAIRGAERSRTLRRVIRFAFLGPASPTPQIIPVALYDFGFKPSIGARLYWSNGYLAPGSRLSIKLATGGLDTWRADLATRIAIPRTPLFVGLAAGARERPDYVFYGLGPDTPSNARARYQDRRAGASLRAGLALPGIGELVGYGAVTDHAFESSHYSGDASIEDRVADGRIAALPAGYPGGYTTLATGASLALDTRPPRGRRQTSGARLDATVERVWDADDRTRAWTRLEASAGGALLLDTVGERKLDLRVRVQRVGSAGGDPIPFLELAIPAGLRGFATGRLRGESAIALIADYQWPLAAWLDAHGHLGVGNVFGPELSGLHAGALRGSAGIGLSIAGLSTARQVRLAASFGTEPFADGFEVSSFRLVLGFADDY